MEFEDKIAKARAALDDAGLYTWELSEGIINVYDRKIGFDGPTHEDNEHYLFTLTVTVTP